MSRGSIKLPYCKVELILKNTFDIGQVFNWEFLNENKVIGTYKDKLLELSTFEHEVEYRISPSGTEEDISQYLNLSVSVNELTKLWKKDKYFASVHKSFPGVRILKQPIFECLISFICSQNSHVKRIASNIQELKTRYGKKICMKYDRTWYAFPTVEELSQATVEVLEFVGLGYRAKYIVKTVKKILDNGGESWLNSLDEKTTDEIREELLKLEGIGPKVADCILLFSFNRFEVVPIDTHMWQIAKLHYGAPNTKSVSSKVYKSTSSTFFKVFGSHAGWAHSILFAASLKSKPSKKRTKK